MGVRRSPSADGENEEDGQRESGGESAGNHVIEGTALPGKGPEQQSNKDPEQEQEPAEEKDGPLALARHAFIVNGARQRRDCYTEN